MLAAVVGFEQAAASAVENVFILPGARAYVPQCRIQDVRVVRIDLDARPAGVVVGVQHPDPRFSAVQGAEDSALCIRSVRMAQDGCIEPIRILRVDGDIGNLLRVAETEMRPSAARVRGTIDPVADGQVRPLQALTARHVDDRGVRGRHRDGADRLGGRRIEQGLPRPPVIRGPPYPAVHGADQERLGLAGHTADGARSPPAERSDEAPMKALRWVVDRRRLRNRHARLQADRGRHGREQAEMHCRSFDHGSRATPMAGTP